MHRTSTWLALSSLLLLVPSVNAQDDAVNVFRQVSPAVVMLHNAASSGTGVVLTGQGLILTNAHVVSNPLPFKCTAEVMKEGKRQTVVFENVKITKVHKFHDLALVKIDPAEHNAILASCRLAREKAITGQRLYAIGNPGSESNVTLTKTITEGLLSGVDRDIDGVKYYQISAAINPGNSGGPLCDRGGTVVGIVTLKLSDVDNVGFAIPMYDIQMSDFEPYSRKTIDAEKAIAILKKSDELLDKTREQFNRENRSDGGKSLELALLEAILFQMCQEAAHYDPNNPDVYRQLGIISFREKSYEAAQAYMQESIRLNPYGYYVTYELLYKSLSQQGKETESLVVRCEAAVKYYHLPESWRNLAFQLGSMNRYKEAVLMLHHAVVVAKDRGESEMVRLCNNSIEAYLKKLPAGYRQTLSFSDSELRKTVNRCKAINSAAVLSGKGAINKGFAELFEDLTEVKFDAYAKNVNLFEILGPEQGLLSEARVERLKGNFDEAIKLSEKVARMSKDEDIRREGLIVRASTFHFWGYALLDDPATEEQSNQCFHNCARDYRLLKANFSPLSSSEQRLVASAVYNEACTFGLENKKKETLATLREAFELGYQNFDDVQNDTDFGDLRFSREFKAIVQEFRSRSR